MKFFESQIKRIEAKKRRKKLILWFFIIVLLAFLIGSVSFFLMYSRERNISIIYVEGELYSGDVSGGGLAGSIKIGKELRNAADNAFIEAIVLRVNSPGGTPAAAQEIIIDLNYAKSKKPVVVSIGDMATSAAYYLSAHANKIYANPDSITGGIGTVWIFYDVSKWLQNEGFNVTVIKSGERKDMTSTFRPLTKEEEAYARELVNRSFERFISDITSQRNISREQIEDGRLIRGEEAKAIGLIDELGNLNDAITEAQSLAHNR